MSKKSTKVLVWAVVLALVLTSLGGALALVLGSFGSGSGGSSGSSAEQPEPMEVEPEEGSREAAKEALQPYYEQELDWEPCPGEQDFRCATLEVPLDYRKPDGETIDLWVLNNPADNPGRRIGSLVVNPGGPGVPGTSYASADRAVWGRPILDRYDVVGFDPRGTGRSAPVDCLSDSELTGFLAADLTPEGEDEIDEAIQDQEEFFAGCAEKSGKIAAHVATVESARDIDVLRAALGQRKLDYFGASYGTKLGATYADLFPDRVGSMVLDGAIDPAADPTDHALAQAKGFETALRSYVENCVNGDSCFLGETVDEGLRTISDLLDEIDEEPLPAGDGRELSVGNAFYGLVLPLYREEYWVLLSSALRSAMNDNGAPLLELADLYHSRRPDGSYEDNSAEAILAINCLDDPVVGTRADVRQAMPRYREASPTFGEAFAWGELGCRGLEFEPVEKPPEIDAEGAAPILVVGTTRDPATPYEWAEALAEKLESGVLLTRDGDGHTAYNSGNACITEAVEGYLIDDEVPEDGTTC